MAHPSHQSIKKHLPYIQHDLFLVNTIVSLYPSIIIPLIPLAICLMLALMLTPKELGREGSLSNSGVANKTLEALLQSLVGHRKDRSQSVSCLRRVEKSLIYLF